MNSADMTIIQIIALNRRLAAKGRRVCPSCKLEQLIAQFPKDKGKNGKPDGACYSCRAKRQMSKYYKRKRRTAWIRRAPGKLEEAKTFSVASVRIDDKQGLVLHERCGGQVIKLGELKEGLIEAVCQKCSGSVYVHPSVLRQIAERERK